MQKWWWLLVATWLAAGPAGAQGTFSVNSPIVVEAQNLPAVLTQPVEALRLLAVTEGRLGVIPFQIDERMEVSVYQSWTRRREHLAYATNAGKRVRTDYDPAFDYNDQLAFMSRDLGPPAAPGQMPAEARVCAELRVQEPETGNQGFAYLCAFDRPPANAPESYVRADDSFRFYTGKSYLLGFPEGNPVNFDQLQILGPGGPGPDLVDRFKTRLDVAVARGLSAYSLSEEDFHYYGRGIKVGPIRIIVETESVLESWFNAQIRVINTITFYSDHVEYLLNTRPPIYLGPVNLSTYTLALDLSSEADRMTFLSEKNPKGVPVDGTLEPQELGMNYGPTEWVAVTGKAGTIFSYLALPGDLPLHKDLYFNDQSNKPDPPEEESGMMGKFGFAVRHLEKIGHKPKPLRLVFWFRPEPYQPGMEKPYMDSFRRPLTVFTDNRELLAELPGAPPAPDQRKEKDQPVPTAEEKPEEQKVTRAVLPNFWLDPYNIGYGGGPSYVDADLLGTGTMLNLMFIRTDRNFQWYLFDISKIPGTGYLEDLRFFLELQEFPSESFFGQGNAAPKDHRSLYWWVKYEGSVTFRKHFLDHYGVDTELSCRFMTLKPGQQARSGGIIYDRLEDHFGLSEEIMEERWGPPTYGREGGYDNRIQLEFYRDFRDDYQVPHRGNYQKFTVEFVHPMIGANYNFTRLVLDLRGYLEPRWLNNLPMDHWFSDRRTFLTKFFGPNKRRSLAGRVVFTHLISPEIDFRGRQILDVPFYDLTPLGGGSNLRGFFGDRFRDYDAAWINLEYRWAYWKFVDWALFVDTGVVMHDIFELRSWQQSWHWGYGFVIRIHVPPAVMATFDIGYSIEEQNYLHQPNWAF
ncbi:MAG: hypothetical protein A2V67_07910 [Deltaproteobacteria bacterium RBG_13_61_14]|nr:MAG: hypothetical protein A2V67_07910 [Deltaproteobacteria bacterium RBG_13_61_14]